jgi:predicted phage tail protein
MVNMPLRRKGRMRDLLACRVSDGHQTVFKQRLNYGKAHLMPDAQSKKAKLLAQREKLDAEIKAIEAKERSQKRKDDTRRKIILGGLVMKAAEGEPNIMGWLKTLANGESVSVKDRVLLDIWFEQHLTKGDVGQLNQDESA